ncbi:MAG: NAD(P)-binding protein [Thermoanaerobaculia bacterium]|nr:NAD(P)-binding protein [Thermoanaerobaculia bacterium]
MSRTIAVVGSGFAGSILARVLALQGHRVTLIDRARHPRFALGESATPLAALSLERLARRWRLDDLDRLAAYGRWTSGLPELRHGLKRGFTFYAHRRGAAYVNGEHDEHRLLVAASPNDEIADSHWVRADVDAHLAKEAAAAGAELLAACSISSLEPRRDGFALGLETSVGAHRRLEVDAVVDGSGRGGFLSRHLPAAARLSPTETTSLIAGHYRGVRSFVDVASAAGASLGDGPYPDEKAAVHHLLDDEWLYVLPFDDGTASAGLVSRRGGGDLAQRLAHYPTLARCFADAERISPRVEIATLPYRSRSAAGDRWALLPATYAFDDPLFSTGIAWSLVAVERLADWGAALAANADDEAQHRLRRYGDLLRLEADHLRRLIAAAWATLADFDGFAARALYYFAAASFCEARQRLCDGAGCWDAFLAADDPLVATWWRSADPTATVAEVRQRIAPRDVAGIGDPSHGRRIPATIEPLLAAGPKLGLDPAELQRRLGRIRGLGLADHGSTAARALPTGS